MTIICRGRAQLFKANWKRRTEIIDYCVAVVDQSLEEKLKVMESQVDDPASRRRTQGTLFAEEVKVSHVTSSVDNVLIASIA